MHFCLGLPRLVFNLHAVSSSGSLVTLVRLGLSGLSAESLMLARLSSLVIPNPQTIPGVLSVHSPLCNDSSVLSVHHFGALVLLFIFQNFILYLSDAPDSPISSDFSVQRFLTCCSNSPISAAAWVCL